LKADVSGVFETKKSMNSTVAIGFIKTKKKAKEIGE